VQIAVTTVLTIIAFAFAISGSLPRVPYLTFIDKFFLTCYLKVFGEPYWSPLPLAGS